MDTMGLEATVVFDGDGDYRTCALCNARFMLFSSSETENWRDKGVPGPPLFRKKELAGREYFQVV